MRVFDAGVKRKFSVRGCECVCGGSDSWVPFERKNICEDFSSLCSSNFYERKIQQPEIILKSGDHSTKWTTLTTFTSGKTWFSSIGCQKIPGSL